MVIAGVMSGSSLDGLDIAIVQFNKDDSWDLLWQCAVPYQQNWVSRIKSYNTLSAPEYIKLKADYSLYIGKLLSQVFDKYDGKIDYVSCHGHTLVHLPQDGITEQIGNGGTIAAIIDTPTFSDFRVQDIAKGGVGTPLAPLVELNLFQGHNYYLNLGGIANLTKIIQDGSLKAYDVCPCNQVLNHYSNLLGKEYDEDGEMARHGSALESLNSYLAAESYFQLPPPKSLDNNWIVEQFIPGIPIGNAGDVLHSYCIWMAKCIANEIDLSEDATSLMVSGGGAHNTYFMECLRTELTAKNCTLYIPSKEIIDNKEAILMALMAYKNLKKQPNVLHRVTGAISNSIGGAFYQV